MVNPKEKYFQSSFRYDKDTPDKFGLKFNEDLGCFLDSENAKWKKEVLWDNGWGGEYGFVRLPELGFTELWTLLLESNIYENQMGSSEFLDRKFPMELKEELTKLFVGKSKISQELTVRLSKLEVLKSGMNRNEVIGKSIKEVESDFKDWQELQKTFDQIKTSRSWDRLLKQ